VREKEGDGMSVYKDVCKRCKKDFVYDCYPGGIYVHKMCKQCVLESGEPYEIQ
jgi:hypothetical protein